MASDQPVEAPGAFASRLPHLEPGPVEAPLKLKGRKRILQSLQRISSSPSLAKLGRKPLSSYRSGTKGSISCVSLSSTASASYGHLNGHRSPAQLDNADGALPVLPSSAQIPDAHFFDPSKSRSGIRLIEAGLASAAATTQPTCPVPTGLRSGSRGALLCVTPEVSEVAHEYFPGPNVSLRSCKDGNKPEHAEIWTSLPDEVKTRVFQFLEPKELVRCSIVSRSWYQLCFDGQLWKSLDASEFYRDITAESLAMIIASAGPFVRDLNLRGCIQLQDSLKADIVAEACRNLEHVSLEGSRVDRSSVHSLLQRNNQLRHLNLTGLAAISNATCKIVARNCRVLKFLNVSWCSNIDDRGIRKVVEGCSQLEDLRVSELRGFDEDLMLSLFRTNNLQRLVMNGCTSLSDRSLGVLLEGLNPEVCPLLNRSMVPARKLRHLDLSRCHHLTNAGLEKLAHNVPDLEGLQLGGCVDVTDAALIGLLPTIPKLTHLDLEEIPGLTNATLLKLAEAPCRTVLEHLSISSCENLGDTGMLPVIRACRNMKNVDMDNTRVSDLVLAEAVGVVRQRARLSASQCRPRVGLRIVVYDCQNVTWTGIREVLSGNAEVKHPSASLPSPSYPTEIIQMKCFYGWQMTVEEHTKRVLKGDLAAASRLERKWAEFMMSNEEAGTAGAGGRRRRRRAREAAMMHADEEEGGVGIGGIGRRRRARSGGCVVM